MVRIILLLKKIAENIREQRNWNKKMCGNVHGRIVR